jgi:limonene-1,2-epoxide hydrolase
MESAIEVVSRFCAGWSDNIGTADLAAFFTDDAVYHNIPQAPVSGRDAIAARSSCRRRRDPGDRRPARRRAICEVFVV